MALVDANYQFLWADVSGVGSQSDASELAEVLRSGEINLPDDAPLPNDDIPHSLFFSADDAFALKSNMMKPYSRIRRPRGDIGRKKIMAIYRTYAIITPYVRYHYPVRTR